MTKLKRGSKIRKAMTAGQGRIVLAGALVAALFSAVGIFHAAMHVAVVRSGYQLSQVTARYNDVLRENEHLKMERATLRSAPRLEAIARARLGLIPPAAGQVVAVPLTRESKSPLPEKTLASAQQSLPRRL